MSTVSNQRATIIDDDEVISDTGEVVQQVATDTQVEDVKQEDTEEEKLPEKYRGKSVFEIARMHQEAEKLLGKQGSELGELRKAADAYIKRTLERQVAENTPAGATAQAEEKIDFFSDPEGAIKKIIEKHPKIAGTEQHLELLRRQEALRTVNTMHPDFKNIVESEPFLEWIGKSKIRQELFRKADAFDVDAADELLSVYKSLNPQVTSKNETTNATAVERRETVKASKTVPSGTMTPSANLESTGKIYRRADLIKLMQTDPDRYESMQDEIFAAYSEGRVR